MPDGQCPECGSSNELSLAKHETLAKIPRSRLPQSGLPYLVAAFACALVIHNQFVPWNSLGIEAQAVVFWTAFAAECVVLVLAIAALSDARAREMQQRDQWASVLAIGLGVFTLVSALAHYAWFIESIRGIGFPML